LEVLNSQLTRPTSTCCGWLCTEQEAGVVDLWRSSPAWGI